jgi:hypothetical protein
MEVAAESVFLKKNKKEIMKIRWHYSIEEEKSWNLNASPALP